MARSGGPTGKGKTKGVRVAELEGTRLFWIAEITGLSYEAILTPMIRDAVAELYSQHEVAIERLKKNREEAERIKQEAMQGGQEQGGSKKKRSGG